VLHKHKLEKFRFELVGHSEQLIIFTQALQLALHPNYFYIEINLD
jgi:hypothetical protein